LCSDEEGHRLIRPDCRHRPLGGVEAHRAASHSPGSGMIRPGEGRSRRPHPGHRPGRPDAADDGRPGAVRPFGRRAGR
jgi:hypothetical protein